MRTLALLAALLLLALQAQAQTRPGNTEETPGQRQSRKENQDMEISFDGAAASVFQNGGQPKRLSCQCRRGGCSLLERSSGTCFQNGRRYTFCCRRVC